MGDGKSSKSADDLRPKRSKPRALTALVSAVAAAALGTGLIPQPAKAATEPVAVAELRRDATTAPAKLVLRPAGSELRLAQEHSSHESHESHESHSSHSSHYSGQQ